MNKLQKEITVVGHALEQYIEMSKDFRMDNPDDLAEFKRITEEIEAVESFMKRLSTLYKLVD